MHIEKDYNEAIEATRLADEYQREADRCRRSGYEEFGEKFFRERELIIAALRFYAHRAVRDEDMAVIGEDGK